MRYPVVLLTLMLSGLAVAAAPPEHPPGLQPVPDGAPGPGDAPAVTIKPSSQGRVVEYRANGKLYMLKVIPKVGKPYFLIDQKGDGQFARQDSLDSGMRPPMWVVKEF
ncbi:DUF2782 domain-containing protein [Thiobacillus denitrificans]|jgi:hypothetical protein|uniref:DUF2782 domain-containing protein n=1 Tax=Thiobacillus denitrificans TaxID=36861 RepID=UPI000363DA3B|nr:DUF2782 domain-containing protein [Thiobacillus denitrificans]